MVEGRPAAMRGRRFGVRAPKRQAEGRQREKQKTDRGQVNARRAQAERI